MSKRLAANSFANLLGALLPAVVSLLTIPYIVKSLGEASYGIFTLVTAIVGYFAIFDINLTSGSIKFISEHNALDRKDERDQVITFCGIIYLGIGVTGCVVIYALADSMIARLFLVSETLVPLAIETTKLAAVGFIFGQVQAYLVSIPQALQRYDISAKLEAAFGVFIALASVLVLWMGYGLYEVILLRVVTSVVNVASLIVACRQLLPGFRLALPAGNIMKPLASFSGFAYLSKVATIVHIHADKLMISSLVGMTALTYYTVPATLVNRVMGMTFRLSSVVYPSASELNARNDLASLKPIYFYATKYIFFLNASFVLLVCLFATEVLHYWIGPVFAEQGGVVVVLIALAMLIDSATNLPSLINDGFGHPRVTGMFAIGGAALNLLLTFVFAIYFGIVGVALGHLLTSIVRTVAFVRYVHGRTIPFSLSEIVRKAYMPVLIPYGVLGAAFLFMKSSRTLEPWQTLFGIAIVSSVMALYGFGYIMSVTHRQSLMNATKRMLVTKSVNTN